MSKIYRFSNMGVSHMFINEIIEIKTSFRSRTLELLFL